MSPSPPESPSDTFRDEPEELTPEDDTDAPDARVGTVIDNRYRLDALVGVGGMGSVYAATHLALGEPVAVKFLTEGAATSALGRARFRREAVALARLRHPGIVSVLDFGEDQGAPYLVMEMIRGADLDDVLSQAGRFTPLRAVAMMDQVLQVLETAHTAGITHRDIKPANVMVLDTGDGVERVKILDFGLAQLDHGAGPKLTAPNLIQGTPAYMAPEQCLGTAVGPPTDVYAAGVMLFELLTGRLPFPGESIGEVMAAQVYTRPPTLAEAGMTEPATGLESIVARVLSKNPAQRPTALAFRTELTEAIHGRDPASLAERAAAERARLGGMSRAERALQPPVVSDSARSTLSLATGRPRIALWGVATPRANTLRTALAVNGIDADLWPADTSLPGGTLTAERPLRAVVLTGPDAAVRVGVLRARYPGVPVLALEVDGAEATAALVRAGVNDATPPDTRDDAVCQRVWRLVRRGR